MNAYEVLMDAGVSPTPLRNLLDIPARKLHRVLKNIEIMPNGCWEWSGGLSPKGYGKVYVAGVAKSPMQAHRLIYLLSVGPVPAGHDLHHRPTCRKRCVHPEHVTALPHEEHSVISNLGVKREPMTHCFQGHEYTEENTIHANGKRTCRTCENQRQRDDYRATHAPRKLKTHCKKGHELTADNTYIYQRWGNEQRACQICRMAGVHRYQEKMRAQVSSLPVHDRRAAA